MSSLTVLFVPAPGLGHEFGSIGIATALLKRGHRVVFAVERLSAGKFTEYGFQEELYNDGETQEGKLKEFKKLSNCFKLPPVEQFDSVEVLCKSFIKRISIVNDQIEDIVERNKPNVIVEDYTFIIPALVTAQIPLVRLFTANPLIPLNSSKIPPGGFGLPLNDDKEWSSYRRVKETITHTLYEYAVQVMNWDKERNLLSNSEKNGLSRNLNIFVFPEFLVNDILKLSPLGEEWIGLDHSIRESNEEFKLPEQLKDHPGKLIYLSLGTFGCADVSLMKKLLQILATSPHKFIVAKGYYPNEYKLSENMWGEAFVPQISVLPLVDLVITHGGSNTVLESLYFAKPLIVLPLFGDQHDNAQRVVELNLGVKLNAYTMEPSELTEAIENVLIDEAIAANIEKVSRQMKESKSMSKVVEKIEFVAQNPKFPNI